MRVCAGLGVEARRGLEVDRHFEFVLTGSLGES